MVLKKKTHFVGTRGLNFNIKFVDTALRFAKLRNKLQPFIENLLYETVIPLLIMTNNDIQQFDTDPIEYIRG